MEQETRIDFNEDDAPSRHLGQGFVVCNHTPATCSKSKKSVPPSAIGLRSRSEQWHRAGSRK